MPGGSQTASLNLFRVGVDTAMTFPCAGDVIVPSFDLTKGLHGSFLECSEFDNHFFGICKGEASSMDPHQTIMMDVAYQAFNAAGFHKA
jgi:hypothetical protein